MTPPKKTFPAETKWEAVSDMYGFIFPTDYTNLIDTYGYGGIDGELSLEDPRVALSRHSISAGLYSLPTDRLPLPMLTPMEPSLFPLASNGSAYYVYLVVADGFADDYELWVGSPKNKTWVHQQGPFVSFLLRLIERRLDQEITDLMFWDLDPIFSPFRGT